VVCLAILDQFSTKLLLPCFFEQFETVIGADFLGLLDFGSMPKRTNYGRGQRATRHTDGGGQKFIDQ
jgi:hypothetical protein